MRCWATERQPTTHTVIARATMGNSTTRSAPAPVPSQPAFPARAQTEIKLDSRQLQMFLHQRPPPPRRVCVRDTRDKFCVCVCLRAC